MIHVQRQFVELSKHVPVCEMGHQTNESRSVLLKQHIFCTLNIVLLEGGLGALQSQINPILSPVVEHVLLNLLLSIWVNEIVLLSYFAACLRVVLCWLGMPLIVMDPVDDFRYLKLICFRIDLAFQVGNYVFVELSRVLVEVMLNLFLSEDDWLLHLV